jgi:hypothetical protein
LVQRGSTSKEVSFWWRKKEKNNVNVKRDEREDGGKKEI